LVYNLGEVSTIILANLELLNRVLRIIFGTKRYEIIEGWRKLHNRELHNL
jgi:hypothetical protein